MVVLSPKGLGEFCAQLKTFGIFSFISFDESSTEGLVVLVESFLGLGMRDMDSVSKLVEGFHLIDGSAKA